jgi:hypothetical protein
LPADLYASLVETAIRQAEDDMGGSRRACTVGLLAGVLGLLPASGGAQPLSAGEVQVVLQNDDVVPKALAGLAQREVVRLFALIHIRVVWIAEELPDARTFRVVKITAWEPPRWQIPATALGLTNEGSHGTRRSYVIWPRVQKTALRFDVGLDAVLAVAIAHELGHLLLPGKSHDERGLMRETWDENDLRLAAVGNLHFSKQAGAKIALGLRPKAAIAGQKPNADDR